MADCTIIDKLNYILETKDLIKTAIETQDVEVLESDTFRKYSEYITEIRKVSSVNGQTGDIVLKTINGQDLVGEGNITIEGGGGTTDLSNYYTKEEIDNIIKALNIPSLDGYATEQWVENKGYLTEHQQLKTINGESIVGEGNITIEGGSGSVAGVESIDVGGVYLNGVLSFSTSTESSDNSWRVGINGEMYDSTTDEYYGNGGSLIFGVKSSDNSIIITDGGSLADLTINPDILSGGTSSGGGTTYTAGDGISISDNTITNTGVTAINIGNEVQDWTQKTGVVSFYTDWYEGSYDVAIGGTSFFGVKPIDNSIILENAGGTVNGNTRCGIKINTDNFKTINGESIIGTGNITIEGGSSSGDGQGLTDIFANDGKLIGMEENGNWRNEVYFKTINGQTIIGEEGDITIEGGSGTINIIELTQAEYDALTEYADNTFYVITDANKQYTTLEEVEQQGYLKEHQQLKTINGESIVGEGNITIEGGITEETDPVFTEWKNADNVIVGNGATYDTTDADAEQIQPSIMIGKGATVWADGIAIGENATSELGGVAIGKNVTSYSNITIGSDNEGNGIIIGKNNSGNGIIIGSGVTENYGGIAIGNNISNPMDYGIAIGNNSKINTKNPNDTDNGYGIAIGVASIAYDKNDVAIGRMVSTDATYTTNINNVLKGDTSNYAYILNADGNYVKIIDTYYTKTEIDNLIGGVSDKISDINSMI